MLPDFRNSWMTKELSPDAEACQAQGQTSAGDAGAEGTRPLERARNSAERSVAVRRGGYCTAAVRTSKISPHDQALTGTSPTQHRPPARPVHHGV